MELRATSEKIHVGPEGNLNNTYNGLPCLYDNYYNVQTTKTETPKH